MLRPVLVGEWMSPAETIAPNSPFRQALAIMERKEVRCLAVVDEGQLVGILTFGDLRHAMPPDETTRRIWDVNHTWDQITVAHLMCYNVIAIEPHETLEHAARLMLKYRISRLPVIDHQGHLLGMLTCYDVYRMMVALHDPKPETPLQEAARSA